MPLSFAPLLPVDRYGAVFTVPLMGVKFTYLIGPEAQVSFYKLKVRQTDGWAKWQREKGGYGPTFTSWERSTLRFHLGLNKATTRRCQAQCVAYACQ